MANRAPDSDKRKKQIIIISAAAVLLVAAIIIVVLAVTGKSETKKKPTTFTEAVTEQITTADTTRAPEPEPITYPAPSYPHGSSFSFVQRDMGIKPQYTDPLTGLGTDCDLARVRPVAVMINNIEHAMPQVGISNADILYECLAEGGITRLLMVTRDYESLGRIGSVRSSREYYIDFAMNHDAVYVHAGGSEVAYSQIKTRGIDHLDGVRADPRTGINLSKTVFYRDPERLETMAYEHTLVTTGELISAGISQMGYRTDTDEVDPIKPVDWGWGVELSGEGAAHIRIPYRSNRVSEYVYDAGGSRYLRFQYNHNEHIDGETGEQLAFENLLILRMEHRNTGDKDGHLVVTTTGTGDGWYVTGGKCIPIKWYKETEDSEIRFTDTEGYDLIVNQGKTAVNIVDASVYSSVTFN